MKNLIIYYSRKGENYFGGSIRNIEKGNSEYVAEYIAEAVGGDLFEIETVKDYAQSYMECIEQAKQELKENARPELKRYLDNISEYDNVFIVGPCWWGTYPMALFSQIDRLDFAGKKILPVMTHEGSGMGHSEKDLKDHIRNAQFVKGLAVHGSDTVSSKKTVADWASKNIQ